MADVEVHTQTAKTSKRFGHHSPNAIELMNLPEFEETDRLLLSALSTGRFSVI